MRYFFFLALALLTCACSRPRETPAAPSDDSRSAVPPPEPAAPPAAAPDPRKVIAVFGDSISAGYGLSQGQSFPDDMQKDLDADHRSFHVVNLGISGDTTDGGVSRIDSATSLHPAIVLLELGGNDGLRGMPVTATRANLEKMIVAFQGARAKVVLAGMTLPPNYGPDYIRDFQQIYTDLAAKYKLILIPFLMQDIITRDLRYIQGDGIHPTAAGSEIIAHTVLHAMNPLLR